MLQAGLVYGAVAASAQAEGPYCLGGGAFDMGAHRVLFFPLSCLLGWADVVQGLVDLSVGAA
jgi:hypothetical protein